jgi:hypothetical protein
VTQSIALRERRSSRAILRTSLALLMVSSEASGCTWMTTQRACRKNEEREATIDTIAPARCTLMR